METFLQNIRKEKIDDTLTTARKALESHLMAFAADISRLEERTVEMKELR